MTTNDPLARNKAKVAAFFEDYSTGNVERIGAHLHDDARWWVAGSVPGISDTYTKAQMLALLEQVTGVYKKGALQFTLSSMIAEGNRVAAEVESYAELHNGKVYNNLYHFLFEIEDGRIKSIKEYLDTQHMHDTFVAGA
jgi:ketosteroid isomerase-like protein